MKMRKLVALVSAMAVLALVSMGCSNSSDSDSSSGDGGGGGGSGSGIYAGNYTVDGTDYNTLTLDGSAESGSATLSGSSNTLSGTYAKSGTRSARAATLSGDYIITFDTGTVTLTVHASSITLSAGSLSADGAGTDTLGVSSNTGFTYYLKVDRDGEGYIMAFDNSSRKFYFWADYEEGKGSVDVQFKNSDSWRWQQCFPSIFESVSGSEGVYYVAKDDDDDPSDRTPSLEHVGSYKNVDVYVAFAFNNEIWLKEYSYYSASNNDDYASPLHVEATSATNPDGSTVYTQTPRSAADIVAGAKRDVEQQIENYTSSTYNSNPLTRTQAILRVRSSYNIKQ